MMDVLAGLTIFQGLSAEGMAGVAARGRLRRFSAGAHLLRQGEPSDALYIIVRGRVRVERSHPQISTPLELADLGPGETVGEAGLLAGAPHFATVRAVEVTEAFELTASEIDEVLQQYPEAADRLLPALNRRLRSTDELASVLRGQAIPAVPQQS